MHLQNSTRIMRQNTSAISMECQLTDSYHLMAISRRCSDRDSQNSYGQDVLGWTESEDYLIAAVCDGISQSKAGDIAASLITEEGLSFFITHPEVSVKDFIRFINGSRLAEKITVLLQKREDSAETVNNIDGDGRSSKAVNDLSSMLLNHDKELSEKRKKAGAATTAQFLILHKPSMQARLIQLGDSPCFLLQKNSSKLFQPLSNQSAWSSESKISESHVEEFLFNIAPDANILLCSDGLSGTQPMADDINSLVEAITSPDYDAKKRFINDRARDDDVTAILIQRGASINQLHSGGKEHSFKNVNNHKKQDCEEERKKLLNGIEKLLDGKISEFRQQQEREKNKNKSDSDIGIHIIKILLVVMIVLFLGLTSYLLLTDINQPKPDSEATNMTPTVINKHEKNKKVTKTNKKDIGGNKTKSKPVSINKPATDTVIHPENEKLENRKWPMSSFPPQLTGNNFKGTGKKGVNKQSYNKVNKKTDK